jgi:tetratricopeptide (TPR) repeat protein
MTKLAEELRQPSQDWLVLVYTGLLSLLKGELAEAERAVAEARSVGERAQSWNAAVGHGLQLYLLRREQGRLNEVEALVKRSVETYPTYRIWSCVLAQMAAELGHADDAREALEAVAVDDFANLPSDEEWLVSVSLLAEAAAALRDPELAADLYRRLLPYSDRVAVSDAEISLGSAARYLGLLAATTERFGDAELHFHDALEVNARIGARPWLARTQEDYGRILLARGTAEREKAHELLADARATYRDLGLEIRAKALSLREAAGWPPARTKR